MSLATDFDTAVARIKTLSKRPSDDQLLQLYALYKQATEGDVHGEEPGVFDFVGRAKYDAWAQHRGLPRDAARQAYIRLVDQLLAAE